MGQCPAGAGVYWAAVGGGRRIPVLKVLRTNVCELNCRYCAINCHRSVKRASFRPEELAKTFMEMHERKMVAGLFLSSGVAGGAIRTAEKLMQTVEILRHRYRFRGYVHLKIMPGQPPDYIQRAVELADRVSINLEAPTPQHLSLIAPRKDFWDLMRIIEEIHRLQRRYPHKLRAGQITQLVVGAAGERDLEILRTAQHLYATYDLRRVYYSAYRPVCGEVLAPPATKTREHRLYQADRLLRLYRFRLEELPFQADGSLPQEVDPKLEWALRHPERFPVEVNRAPWEELVRVPGIGPTGAERIIALRRQTPIREPRALASLGIRASRALPFLLLDGRYWGGQRWKEALDRPEEAYQLAIPLAEP